MGKWDDLHPYDEKVQAALAAGEENLQVFEVLLEGYHKVVVQFCIMLLGHKEDGEDVAHEVFVDIFHALPRYQPRDLLRAWVFRIARNRCYTFREQLWNRIRIQTEHDSDIPETTMSDPPPPPEDVLIIQDLLDRLGPSLRQLPKRDRVFLLMHYWEELSFRAMARQLRSAEATVRRAVHAAEARLRALMTQDEQ